MTSSKTDALLEVIKHNRHVTYREIEAKQQSTAGSSKRRQIEQKLFGEEAHRNACLFLRQHWHWSKMLDSDFCIVYYHLCMPEVFEKVGEKINIMIIYNFKQRHF